MDQPMKDFLSKLVELYLGSGESSNFKNFNGVAAAQFNKPDDYMRQLLKDAITNRYIDATSATLSPNPHVRSSAQIPTERQLLIVSKESLGSIFVYPLASISRGVVDSHSYPPYAYQLALGRGVHEIYYFNPAVLDCYGDDTKFDLSNDGYVFVREDYFDSLDEEAQDTCWGLVKHIGFRKRLNGDRVRTMCLAYLCDLMPDEQKHWSNFELLVEEKDFFPDTITDDEQFHRWYHGTIQGNILG